MSPFSTHEVNKINTNEVFTLSNISKTEVIKPLFDAKIEYLNEIQEHNTPIDLSGNADPKIIDNYFIEIVPVETKQEPNLIRIERNVDNSVRWLFREEYSELSQNSLFFLGKMLVNNTVTKLDKTGKERHYLKNKEGKLLRITKAVYDDISFFDETKYTNNSTIEDIALEPIRKNLTGNLLKLDSFTTRQALDKPISEIGRNTKDSRELGKTLNSKLIDINLKTKPYITNTEEVDNVISIDKSSDRKLKVRKYAARIAAAATLLVGTIIGSNASNQPEANAEQTNNQTTYNPSRISTRNYSNEQTLYAWTLDHPGRKDGAQAVAKFVLETSPEAQQRMVEEELKAVLNRRYNLYDIWLKGPYEDVLAKLEEAKQEQSSDKI